LVGIVFADLGPHSEPVVPMALSDLCGIGQTLCGIFLALSIIIFIPLGLGVLYLNKDKKNLGIIIIVVAIGMSILSLIFYFLIPLILSILFNIPFDITDPCHRYG